MGKFDNLLYDCTIQLNEALDGEPRPEELDNPDYDAIKDPEGKNKTFKAFGFDYYTKFNPENGEDEDTYNKKANLISAINTFEEKYRVIFIMYDNDPDVMEIKRQFYFMRNSVSAKT